MAVRKGRITIVDGEGNCISGVIKDAGLFHGHAGRAIAALSEDPSDLPTYLRGYTKFSEVPLEEVLEQTHIPLPLNSVPGDDITTPDPLELLNYDFAIFIDLNDKKVRYNNTNVPRTGVETYFEKDGENMNRLMKYSVPDNWEFEIVNVSIPAFPVYSPKDDEYKGNINVAIIEANEGVYTPLIFDLDALPQMLSSFEIPLLVFRNVSSEYLSGVVHPLVDEMNDYGECALKKFLKEVKIESSNP
ncbi:MAG: hypothetical protein J7K73_03870 [Nanoarchaeota archaeon]|nr:hypothetical protein [Nanoarchaeota archaeon]